MTLNVFPMLPANSAAPQLSWTYEKAPNWSTRLQRSVSGRELRSPDYPTLPLYTFTLRYERLLDRWDVRMGQGAGPAYRFDPGGHAFDELRAIWEFYNNQWGPGIPFVFYDYSDNTTRADPSTPQVANFATGDGTTVSFQMASALFAPVIPDTVVSVTPAISYSIDSDTGIITFASPPGAGTLIGADMTYKYKVRFGEDSLKAENFAFQFWQMQTVKLVSVV